MKKRRYGLSVITYTYDDHELAAGLLASIDQWDFEPQEVVVVDDGSKTTFAPPPGPRLPRVVRLPDNQGPAQAKVAGLGAASGRFLLSLDADIRLPPDWATRLLPLAARPQVGLVGSPILTDVGEGLLADYQRLYYSHMVGLTGAPKIVPAGVWLLRREVWLEHGFTEYRERLHEDDYFSAKLRAAGLDLVIAPEPAARQVRRLSRRTMVRRGFTWQGREYRDVARTRPTDAVNAFLLAMQRRIARHVAADPRFLYYDYLYLGYALAVLAREGGFPEPVVAALAARLAWDLPGSELPRMFGADMADLGIVPAAAGPHPFVADVRRGVRSVLPPDAEAALLAAEPCLIEEDARRDWHFSFYDA